MADVHYHNIETLAHNGDVDLPTDVTKVALITDGYTPNADHTQIFDFNKDFDSQSMCFSDDAREKFGLLARV